MTLHPRRRYTAAFVTVAPPVPAWVLAPRDAATVDGAPLDVLAQNAAAIERLRARVAETPDAPLVVVPGYVPPDADGPVALHRVARERLASALRTVEDLGALGLLVSGGNVAPAGTPFNQAFEMRRALRETFRVDERQVLLDPYARRPATCLRNAGRLMRAHGIGSAVVVTDFGHTFYGGASDIDAFAARCEELLGHPLGRLEAAPWFTRIRYTPSVEVERRGDDPLDP